MKLNNIVMFACNEGGHFSQMMALKSLFGKYRTVIVTDNDRATVDLPGLEEIEALEYAMGFADKRRKLAKSHKILTRRSYISGYLKLFVQCLKIWLKYRPKVIVSTGSNIAVAMFLWGHLFGSKIIYIESRAKVRTKNVTGSLCGNWCDKIIVQWPEMTEIYGERSEYHGILV